MHAVVAFGSDEKSNPPKSSETLDSDLTVPKNTDCFLPSTSEIDCEKVQVQSSKENIEGTIFSQKQLLNCPQNDLINHSKGEEGLVSSMNYPKFPTFCDERVPIEDDFADMAYSSDFEMPEIVLADDE
jgi:hypothetical protein